jgi:hypothetical protein
MTTKLQSLDTFKGCTDKQLRRVDELSTRLTFDAGRRITRNGNSGRQVIMICSGTVVVERNGRTIATASADEVVATIAAPATHISGESVSLHALTNCEVMVLSRGEFIGLELDLPDVAARIRHASTHTNVETPASASKRTSAHAA